MAFPFLSFVNFPLSKIKNLIFQAPKSSSPKNIKAHKNTRSPVWTNKAKLKKEKGSTEKVEGRTGNSGNTETLPKHPWDEVWKAKAQM